MNQNELNHILQNMQLEIDSLKRDIRSIKTENRKIKQQLNQSNKDMIFHHY